MIYNINISFDIESDQDPAELEKFFENASDSLFNFFEDEILSNPIVEAIEND